MNLKLLAVFMPMLGGCSLFMPSQSSTPTDSGSGYFGTMSQIENTAASICKEGGGKFGDKKSFEGVEGLKVDWEVGLEDKTFQCRIPEITMDIKPIVKAAAAGCKELFGSREDFRKDEFGPKTRELWSVEIDDVDYECRVKVPDEE